MEEEYQSFRIAPDGNVVTRIEVSTDEATGLQVVFWEDIEFQYPGIHCVKNGDIAVSFARDSKRKRLDPLCIKHHPGVILDVVLASSSHAHISQGAMLSLLHSSGSGDSNDFAAKYNSVTSLSPGQSPSGLHAMTHLPSQNSPSRSNSNSRSPNSPFSYSLIPQHLPLPLTPPSPTFSTTSQELEPKIQSTLQTSADLFNHFEQSIKSGQLHQAESIKQEIRTAFGSLEAEMARNKELQLQMLNLQRTAQEMQERMLAMQRQAMDRLALIQSRIQAVLTQTYELHEYPIPRLFIVLPAETQRRDKVLSPFTTRFRLYFLCECGEHTRIHRQQQPEQQQEIALSLQDQNSRSENSVRNVDGIGTGINTGTRMATHHIHLAKHEGYDLDRPNEFFQKYGSHILTLLQMLKYGIVAAGFIVPPLAQLKLVEGIDKVQNELESSGEKGFESKLEVAIQYLETLARTTGGGTPDNGIATQYSKISIKGNFVDPNSGSPLQGLVHGLEALEGADLRHLSTFLNIKDESKVLGNLYRIVTSDGHVKWVCLDHYRENYRESGARQLKDVVKVNGGSFVEPTGQVRIRLSSSVIAKQFYEALEKTKCIQELRIVLDWETTLDDLRTLRDTLRKTNIVSLDLDLCSSIGPSRDILNRNRRYDPIMQIIASAKLQILRLHRCDGFWSRMTKSVASASSDNVVAPLSSISPMIQLRALSVEGTVESSWRADQHRLEDLLRSSPRLTELKMQCLDVDATFGLIKNATGGFRMLRVLHLTVNQSDQKEQVDIIIAQPQQEIVSITIESKRKNCTHLAYSGYVQTLVLLHDFDVASDKAHLERILSKNRRLNYFGATCFVQDFVAVSECLRTTAIGHPSLQHLELRDNGRRNRVVFSPPLVDNHANRGTDSPADGQEFTVQLQLWGSDSTGREEIFRSFGWALRKIPLGFRFTVGLMQGLLESMRSKGSSLESVHAYITYLTAETLDSLADMIEFARETLIKVEVHVWERQASGESIVGNTKALSRFIVRVSAQITKLNIHAYSLAALLKELAPAAAHAAAAAASASRGQVLPFAMTSHPRRSISSFPDNPHLRGGLASDSNSGSSGGASVARSVTTVRRPSANPPPIVMSKLRVFEIQPEADASGKMTHCQINTPDLQWLSIPLSAPTLVSVKLGFLDILTHGWSIVLQSIGFNTLTSLVLEGTNIWDGQVKLLIECLEKTRARALLCTPPQVHQMQMLSLHEFGRRQESNGVGGGVALQELTINGSLITPPVLAGLGMQVRQFAPECRVITA
ncbi:hypothetical protein BGX28_009435 [Mortierella sp. GBA30]|nr:hypothetical protein BGX28_009435 [Mortierella sp. GBA30]